MELATTEESTQALADLQAKLADAQAARIPLRIIGGDTKHAWWHTSAVTPLSLRHYTGVVAYEPSELVITARAGTLLSEIEQTLAVRGQMLGFEPPRLGRESTLGGVVAAALSGPARPYRGGVRDYVLGVRLLSATGEVLRFGGQVMKNVAGYDLSRLVTGAWGRLGPLLEISLRVSPQPAQTVAVRWRCDESAACQRLRAFGRTTLPISAARYDGQFLHVRLSGAVPAVAAALASLAPEVSPTGLVEWQAWRDFTHPFFAGKETLWRAIVPAATAPLAVAAECVWDWGGALRWFKGVADPGLLRQAVTAAGGHVRPWPGSGLEPLADALTARVISSFDPMGLFNPP